MDPFSVPPVAPNPAVDTQEFASLSSAVTNWLTDRFVRWWPFTNPTHSSLNSPRQYAQGTWEPIPQTHPHKALGGLAGGGIVHMWLCVDGNGKIIDRVIVKNCYPGQVFFNSPWLWHNGIVGGEPLESAIANQIHKELANSHPGAGDEKHVTQCLGWGDVRVTPHLWQYKLYYEYCMTDLRSLVYEQWYRRRMVRLPGRKNKKAVDDIDVPLPEGFLWMLFEALAKTAVAMDTLNGVHGDMQISNIFFGFPDPTRFAIWPVPKLADFGSARFLTSSVRNRVPQALGGCLNDYAPPELYFDINTGADAVPGVPLSNKTNIWQIGINMCCALRLKPLLDEMKWQNPPNNYNVPIHRQLGFANGRSRYAAAMRHHRARYSRALLILVRRCLRFDPASRSSPADLLRDIQHHMQGKLGGMDTYTTRTGRVPWNHPQALHISREDKFRVGKKPTERFI